MSAEAHSGDENAIHGKVVVMTGATSGIGQVAAEHLAKSGARIIFVARDPQRAAVTLDRLQTISSSRHHVSYYADLSSLSEMKRVGAAIAAAEQRIDVLVNNAGAMFSRREVTQDGLERARIIVTASNAHRKGRLDLDDLQSERNYSAPVVYGTSKLCNILFTHELAHRLAPHGVTANSFSPGFVATRFGDEAGGLAALALRAGKLFAKTPEEGARTLPLSSLSACNLRRQW